MASKSKKKKKKKKRTGPSPYAIGAFHEVERYQKSCLGLYRNAYAAKGASPEDADVLSRWEGVVHACRFSLMLESPFKISRIRNTHNWAQHIACAIQNFPELAQVPYTPCSVKWMLEVVRAFPVLDGWLRTGGMDAHLRPDGFTESFEHTIQTWVLGVHRGLGWERYHFPTINPSKALLAGFSLTDTKGVPEEIFKVPFSTFAFGVPTAPAFMGPGPYTGFYHEHTNHSINDELLHTPLEDLDVTSTLLHMIFLMGRAQHIQGAWDVGTFLDEDTDPDDTLQKKSGKLVATKTSLALNTLRRIIVNTCIYVNECKMGDTTQTPRIRAEKPKDRLLTSAQNSRTWSFGNTIEIAPEIHACLDLSLQGTGVSIKKWKLKTRSIRRGHWRNQAYGPRWSLRRRQWIAPHPIGDPNGLRVAHDYKVNSKGAK